MSELHIKQAQVLLGVNPDGDFGPKTLAAVQRQSTELDAFRATMPGTGDDEAPTARTGCGLKYEPEPPRLLAQYGQCPECGERNEPAQPPHEPVRLSDGGRLDST